MSSWSCSVGFNDIVGDGAESLANVVLEHTTLTDFCSIPLVSLRENTLTELNLDRKGVGVPGAIVLSSLLPSATTLKTLEYVPVKALAFHSCHHPLTLVSLPFHSVSGNSLKEEGAKHLASALAVNQTLTSIEYAASHLALAVTTR